MTVFLHIFTQCTHSILYKHEPHNLWNDIAFYSCLLFLNWCSECKTSGENLATAQIGILIDIAEHSCTKTGSIRPPYFNPFTKVGSQRLKNCIVLVSNDSLTLDTIQTVYLLLTGFTESTFKFPLENILRKVPTSSWTGFLKGDHLDRSVRSGARVLNSHLHSAKQLPLKEGLVRLHPAWGCQQRSLTCGRPSCTDWKWCKGQTLSGLNVIKSHGHVFHHIKIIMLHLCSVNGRFQLW